MSGYCPRHDPARRTEAHAASVKGGQGKGRIARAGRLIPSTLKPVLSLLLDAMEQTHRGELDPRVAGAVAALAGAIVRTFQAGAVEERLAALEHAYHERERRA